MSVTTTADEHLESARDHIKDAIKDLCEIVVKECWGHDEYGNDFKEEIDGVFKDLLLIKKRLA